jgi:hypothetical protein
VTWLLVIGAVVVIILVLWWNAMATNPDSRYERWKQRHFHD